MSLVLSVVSDLDNKAVKVLYVDGETVGIIDSPKVYSNAKEDAESILSERYGIAYRFPDESAYFRISSKVSGECLTKQEICDFLLDKAEKNFSDGYGLYIDDILVTVGKDREDVEKILSETVDLYTQLYGKIKTTDDIIVFASKTRVEEMRVSNGVIKSYEEMRKIIGLDDLSELNEGILHDGELSDSMTIRDISLMMPEYRSITEEDISLGLPAENIYYIGGTTGEQSDLRNREEESSSMSFKSSAVEVITQIIPCEEEIIYDRTLKQGKKILIKSGIYGIKEMTYDVTYSDGKELTRVLMSEEIVKEPVSKVYRVGSKPAGLNEFVQAQPGDSDPGPQGFFIMPTSGTITSQFAGRNLFGKLEFHGALDIANKIGTPVYASDGGTVILAEWFSTYGNCIIIDHGNGLKTLYAHLSSYSVKKGDVVGQGWKIGAIGMTGRVTGSHLHFEVMVNDVKVDPMEYLK